MDPEIRLDVEEAVKIIEFLASALHIIAYATQSDQDFDRRQTLADALFGIEKSISNQVKIIQRTLDNELESE